jgi:hypothetical protein
LRSDACLRRACAGPADAVVFGQALPWIARGTLRSILTDNVRSYARLADTKDGVLIVLADGARGFVGRRTHANWACCAGHVVQADSAVRARAAEQRVPRAAARLAAQTRELLAIATDVDKGACEVDGLLSWAQRLEGDVVGVEVLGVYGAQVRTATETPIRDRNDDSVFSEIPLEARRNDRDRAEFATDGAAGLSAIRR